MQVAVQECESGVVCMRFVLVSFLVVFGLLSYCEASELWVTFDVKGERYRTQIRDNDIEASSYARAFIKGDAPSRVPEKTALSWLAAAKLTDSPETVHIARVEECRDGVCVALPGLYAGRSPAQ